MYLAPINYDKLVNFISILYKWNDFRKPLDMDYNPEEIDESMIGNVKKAVEIAKSIILHQQNHKAIVKLRFSVQKM